MLAREVAKWSQAVRKAERVRKQHPGQVLDVIHGDFHRDPMAVLERIYGFIGMDITADSARGFMVPHRGEARAVSAACIATTSPITA
jgi:hypothetical protein